MAKEIISEETTIGLTNHKNRGIKMTHDLKHPPGGWGGVSARPYDLWIDLADPYDLSEKLGIWAPQTFKS